MSSANKPNPYMGPTVAEAAKSRIRLLEERIAGLQENLAYQKKLAERYAGSKMLEAERVASQAESWLTPIAPAGSEVHDVVV